MKNQPHTSPIDSRARQNAVDPQRSFIVSAPAGSGKTGLLTLRVLKLLAVVNKPEEIVCITFTRKAASEMRERIFLALEQGLAHSDKSDQVINPYELELIHAARSAIEQSKRKAWDLLENPYRLTISTIDGFCRSICSQLPFGSGIGPGLSISTQAENEYRSTVREWLELSLSGEAVPALTQLIKHLSGNISRLQELLIHLLSIREQWLPLLYTAKSNPDEVRAYFESTLSQWIEAQIERSQFALLPYESILCDLFRYANQHTNDAKLAKHIEILGQYDVFPDLDEIEGNELLEYWRALATLCLSNEGHFRKRLDKNCGFPAGRTKEEKTEAKIKKQQLLSIFTELIESGFDLDAFNDLKTLPNNRYEDGQWEILLSLFELLPELVAHLAVQFNTAGKTDFTQISLSAVQALNGMSGDIRIQQKLDYRIQHLLIDEFQDTSQTQLDLLHALTREWMHDDGRSLFLVGDGMQSCYSFRNANVGIFLQLREQGLDNIRLNSLDLSVNFRSEPGIIDWVNRVFTSSFPSKNDPNYGAVKYIPSSSYKSDKSIEGDSVKVSLFSANHPESSELEANAIADDITLIRSRTSDETIAILAKSRAHLQSIIAVLQARDIPFQAQEIDRLDSKRHIIDLRILTRLLLFPSDKATWLALLRMPCVALTHAELHLFFTDKHENDERFFSACLLMRLVWAQEHGEFSGAAKVRIEKVHASLCWAFEQVQRRKLSEVVELLWIRIGGFVGFTQNAEYEDVQAYFKILEVNEKENTLQDWPTFLAALERLFANSPSHHQNAVQLMTMHKSKGLEFDYVFLPALERSRRGADTKMLYWMEKTDVNNNRHFLLSPISPSTEAEPDSLSQFIRSQNFQRTVLEDTRVFYVACTRAKKQLFLSARLKVDDEGNSKPPAKGSLLSKIWPSIQDQIHWHEAKRDLTVCTNNTYLEHQNKQTILALPSSWADPLKAYHEREAASVFKNDSVSIFQSYHDNEFNSKARGIVFHRILKTLCDLGMTSITSAKIESMRVFWIAQLRQEGIRTIDAEPITQDYINAIKRLRNDKFAQFILSHQHAFSACELKLTRADTDSYHIIDRVIVNNNECWIIDYKTSEPKPEQTWDDFDTQMRKDYKAQLQGYRHTFDFHKTQLINLSTPIKFRLGLYLPFIQRLIEL